MNKHGKSSHKRGIVMACLLALLVIPGVASATGPLLFEADSQSGVELEAIQQSDEQAQSDDGLPEEEQPQSFDEEELAVEPDLMEAPQSDLEEVSTRSIASCQSPIVNSYVPPNNTDERGVDSVLGGQTLEDTFDLPKFTRIDGGAGAVFAAADNGTYWNWGQSSQAWGGVLAGDGNPAIVYRNTTNGSYPNFGSIAFQRAYAVAIDQDCHLWVVGNNEDGQLGTGDRTDRSSWVPLTIPDGRGGQVAFQSVSVSGYLSKAEAAYNPVVTLAIDTTGRIWKWGGWNNCQQTRCGTDVLTPAKQTAGVLGDPAWTFTQAVPPYATTVNAPSLAHIIGTNRNNPGKGQLFSWAIGAPGAQPASLVSYIDAETVTSSTIVAPHGEGNTHGVMVRSKAGYVYRVFSTEGRAEHVLQPGGYGVQATKVESGLNLTMMLDAQGNVYTTGDNTFGQLGIGYSNEQVNSVNTAQHVKGLPRIVDIAAAGETAFALTEDGKLWAWGSNDNGEMAIGCDHPGAVMRENGGCLYLSPVELKLTPSVQITFGEENTSGAVQLSPADIIWENRGGFPTGKVTYKVPEHVAGNVPIQVRFGLYDPAGGATPPYTHPIDELAPLGQLGTYSYMLPLKNMVVPSNEIPVDGTTSIFPMADLPNGKKHLVGNPSHAAFLSDPSDNVTLDASEWSTDSGIALAYVTSSKAGSVRFDAWNEVSGRVFSYNTSGNATANLQQCASDPLDSNGNVLEACKVSGSIDFASVDATIYVRKMGQSTAGTLVEMSGSEWKIYDDANGKPAATPRVDSLATAESSPGVPIKGVAEAILPPGTYWLEESKAPTGFQLLPERIPFTVTSQPSSVGKVPGADPAVYGLVSMETHSNGTPMITVSDVPIVNLPDTSGTRLIGFTVLGIALIVLGAGSALVYRTRRAV